MEHTCRGVEAEILVGCDARGQPSLGSCPFEREHMISYTVSSEFVLEHIEALTRKVAAKD